MREAAGMNQAELGALIGVNKSHASKLELGQVRLDIVRARVLAQRFACPIESLF
jgi:DNA-binding XRE family transcriptional regulator